MLYIFEEIFDVNFVKLEESWKIVGKWLKILPLLLGWTGHLLQEAPGGVPRSSCVVLVLCVEFGH